MSSKLGSTTTNLRILGLMSTAIALSFWSQAQVDPHSSPIAATIDPTQVKGLISKYMYGIFIKHVGNLITHSLWSEMLDDPLDISAAFTDDRKFLTVAIVNPTEEAQSVNLHVRGVPWSGEAKMWQMTGPSPKAADVFAKAPEVQVKENDLSSAPETLQIAPVSIAVYRFAVATVAARPQIEPGMTALSVPEKADKEKA